VRAGASRLARHFCQCGLVSLEDLDHLLVVLLLRQEERLREGGTGE